MDTQPLLLKITNELWSLLRAEGFTDFTSLTARRFLPEQIHVVALRAIPSEVSESHLPSSISFDLSVGIYFPVVPPFRPEPDGRDPKAEPRGADCHLTLRLTPPRLPESKIWSLAEDGADLTRAMLDTKVVLKCVGLPWYKQFESLDRVVYLYSDVPGIVEQNPPPRDHELDRMVGYIAKHLGQTELASKLIEPAEQALGAMEPLPAKDEDYWVEFDLSALTYLEFLAYFFDRPILDDNAAWKLFRVGVNGFIASRPDVVISHMTEMSNNWVAIAQMYSADQIEQALWAIFSGDIDCAQFLFDARVDLAARIRCIESMYIVFRDVVTLRAGDPQDSFYWMWWDMILSTGALRKHPQEYRFGYAKLTADEAAIIDTIFRTLSRILDIPHRGCQWAAIHGMGHLYHPEVQMRLQRYLDEHRGELSEDDVMWIQAAGQNRIM